MTGFYAIFEVIRAALVWAMGLVLDREPQTGEAFRLLSLIVFTGIATWLSFYWRDLALRSRTIRRRLLPDERYAGRYLQAVRRGDEIRYAIVRIFYNTKKRQFEALGRNYNSSGEEVSSFRSNHIVFPAGNDNDIEFIWQGKRAATGYTCMKIETSDDDYIEGDGYVIAFGQKPKTFPIRFKHLHGGHVRQALGIDAPARPDDEARFIRKFHAELGDAVRHGFESAAEEVA
ncbi:MAG: hypothetical protein ACLPX9_11900 [Rhodomicrobium sp.]